MNKILFSQNCQFENKHFQSKKQSGRFHLLESKLENETGRLYTYVEKDQEYRSALL